MLTIPSPSRSLCWASLWSLLLLVALLLILESRFFPTYGMVVDLPSSCLADEPAFTRHAVALKGASRCVIEGEICSWDRLEEKLATLNPEPLESLLLHCDSRTPLVDLLFVGELAMRAGFHSLQIALPTIRK